MRLLELFHEITLRPQSAKELKALILQLAVQGKLTANWRAANPNVEPATKLLKRIEAEKEQLIKEKKLRKEVSLSAIDNSEITFQLPNNWLSLRLGEIGDWGAGATPLRSNSLFYGGDINWFKSGELNNSVINYESEEKITDLALAKTSLRLNKPGDVLIAMYGATIGKTGVLAVYGTTNQAVCACTPFCGITSDFLHIVLKALKEIFLNQGEGGAQPNISRIKIRNQVFALPPLEEQKAIVAIVESLFQEIEQLEQLTKARIEQGEDFVNAALRELSAGDTPQAWSALQPHFQRFFKTEQSIKKLRESILQLAVQGKLTANWRAANPNVEPASELLERIQAEKAQLIKEKKIKKEDSLPAIKEDEKPFELPDGWEWCRLRELTEVITKGSSPKWQGVQYVDEYSGGVLFVTSENVGNYKLILDNKKFVEAKFNEIEPRSILKKNDILMNIVGGSIGRTAKYDIDDLANINQAVTIIRLLANSDHDYFLHFFNSPVCVSYMYDKQVDNARPNLSMGNIAKFITPIPPLKEQKAIVAKVNQLMAFCDELEDQIKQNQTYSEQLMQSVVREVVG